LLSERKASVLSANP
jgi:metal-sulfur cluster biosynthetic enzyme